MDYPKLIVSNQRKNPLVYKGLTINISFPRNITYLNFTSKDIEVIILAVIAGPLGMSHRDHESNVCLYLISANVFHFQTNLKEKSKLTSTFDLLLVSGPKVIKHFSCSTQLSMKLIMPTTMLKCQQSLTF